MGTSLAGGATAPRSDETWARQGNRGLYALAVVITLFVVFHVLGGSTPARTATHACALELVAPTPTRGVSPVVTAPARPAPALEHACACACAAGTGSTGSSPGGRALGARAIAPLLDLKTVPTGDPRIASVAEPNVHILRYAPKHSPPVRPSGRG